MKTRSILLAILMPALAGAETVKDEAAARAVADSTMAIVATGDLAAAFESMRKYTVIPKAEFDSMALKSESLRDQFGKRYGKSTGFEYLEMEKKGESIIKLVYIEKTEKTGLPWIFYFYKTAEGWTLNSFFWNDQLPILFK